MDFLYGVLGCLAVLVLFLGGGFAGWKLHGYVDGKRYKRDLSDEETKRILQERLELEAQQSAFHTLQNYSAERAYGMLADEELSSGGAG